MDKSTKSAKWGRNTNRILTNRNYKTKNQTTFRAEKYNAYIEKFTRGVHLWASPGRKKNQQTWRQLIQNYWVRRAKRKKKMIKSEKTRLK